MPTVGRVKEIGKEGKDLGLEAVLGRNDTTKVF